MKKFLIVILGCIIFSLINSKSSFAHKKDGKFVHTVFFWLKNPDSKEDKDKFEASLKKLITNSLHIKTSHVGIPASTRRPVIDHSYSYCLNLTFDSKEQHDKYQVELAHDIFMDESKNLWQKVLIYDSDNIFK